MIGTSKTDVFILDGPEAATIRKFNPAEDYLAIDHERFVFSFASDPQRPETYAPLGDWEFLRGGRFAAGDNPAVIYNEHNGKLWYDADGEGGIAAQLAAVLKAHLKLTESDISVG